MTRGFLYSIEFIIFPAFWQIVNEPVASAPAVSNPLRESCAAPTPPSTPLPRLDVRSVPRSPSSKANPSSPSPLRERDSATAKQQSAATRRSPEERQMSREPL